MRTWSKSDSWLRISRGRNNWCVTKRTLFEANCHRQCITRTSGELTSHSFFFYTFDKWPKHTTIVTIVLAIQYRHSYFKLDTAISSAPINIVFWESYNHDLISKALTSFEWEQRTASLCNLLPAKPHYRHFFLLDRCLQILFRFSPSLVFFLFRLLSLTEKDALCYQSFQKQIFDK